MSYKFSIPSSRMMIVAALFIVLTAAFTSAQVIYSFQPRSKPHDGSGPRGALIVDSSGTFYGTTYDGGQRGLGVVFELAPSTTNSGTWMEDTIYNFSGTSISGSNPQGTLFMDAQENLYGTTTAGQVYDIQLDMGMSQGREPLLSFYIVHNLEHPGKRIC